MAEDTKYRLKKATRVLREDLTPTFQDRLGQLQKQSSAGVEPGAARPDMTEGLLVDAIRLGASDLHLEPHHEGTRVRLRVDGVVWDVAHLPEAEARLLLNQFKAMADLDPITRFTPRDAHSHFELPEVRLDLRLALAPSTCGEALAIRLLDPRRLNRSIAELGLTPESLKQLQVWLEANNGMFLAAGPTGSGKTTTVYSLLHELKASQKTFITLEDPVEYQIDGITQIQVDELHQLTFAQGARSMLRLDPDYLMLGEVRDATSAHTAVSAALTGRVLLSTIHCRDAASAVTVLRNWNLADHEIAEALSIIVAQRLIRRLCLKCRSSTRPSDADAQWLKALGYPPPRKVWTSEGCKDCRKLGYQGRIALFEVWRLVEEDYSLILNHADEHAIRRKLADNRHSFLMHDALNKVAQGVTSLSEVRRIAGSIFPGQRLPDEGGDEKR